MNFRVAQALVVLWPCVLTNDMPAHSSSYMPTSLVLEPGTAPVHHRNRDLLVDGQSSCVDHS
jgi:hypothetical protein